jgi:Uma2 family endonuclease
MSAIAPTQPVSPATSAGATDRASTCPEPYRFTVDQYERMAEAGILTEDDRVELIDGIVVKRMAKGPAHVWATKRAGHREAMLGNDLSLRREAPARIPPLHEPEPDLVIARGDDAAYLGRHPEPREIALIVEVSDTTYRLGRGDKYRAFAEAGIAVYWIVNLVDRRVEVYTRPTKAGRYRSRKDYKPGQGVPVVIADQQLPPIAVDDILP